MKKLSVLFVLISGTCWAGMTICVRMLRDLGLGTLDVVLVRCAMTSLLLFLLLLITDRGKLKLKLKDLWIFILDAVVTVLLFNYCYFRAVNSMSIAVAVVLLYISPAFVMLLSALILKEKITRQKVFALLLMLAGTIFVTGILGSRQSVTLAGFLLGIGAAVFYAMISIINPIAIRRGYSGATITFYTYLFAMVGALFVADRGLVFRTVTASGGNFLLALGFAIVSTVLPFILYNTALKYIEPSRAAIICSIEPIVGTLISVFLYHEPMTALMILGILLIMAGIICCNLKPKGSGD